MKANRGKRESFKAEVPLKQPLPEIAAEESAPFADMTDEERFRTWSQSLGIPFRKDILGELDFSETFHIPIQYFKRLGIVPLSRLFSNRR